MMGLSASHLLLLSVVVLLFGGRRIPEVAFGLGKGLRDFRSALNGQAISTLSVSDNSDLGKGGEVSRT
jgi:sec-independent protein translocase protein TatA